MEKFDYGNDQVSEKEIMIAVSAMVISVGVLSLPKELAITTQFSDGWIVIIIGGCITIFFTWLAAKLATRFPRQSFLDYTTLITTKPIAIVLTFLFSVLWVCGTAFQMRKIADISKLYLFSETPIEIIAFTFFLVVIYAVSGPTVGLLRLNMLFMPIILLISLIIIAFNITWFEFGDLLPMFETSPSGYAKGIQTSIFSFGGFSIVLFYITYVEKPKKTAKMAAMGMIIPIVLYLLLFLSVMSVFGHSVTQNLLYPTIELAKTVDIPGGLLERFESIFFVIWIMAIFNTAAMGFDIAVTAMNTIFKKRSKISIICILAPLTYLVSMIPEDLMAVDAFGSYFINTIYLYSVSISFLLLMIAKLRGVKGVAY